MNTSFETTVQPDGSNRGEYLTPRWILDALGAFDLDPCASEVRPWPTAARHYTVQDDGLIQPWAGRVWCNPPYGRNAAGVYEEFLERMAEHGNGILLVFARTETTAFQKFIFPRASGFLFLAQRVRFCDTSGQIVKGRDGKDGSPGSPSMLVSFDTATPMLNDQCLSRCGLKGHFLPNRQA